MLFEGDRVRLRLDIDLRLPVNQPVDNFMANLCADGDIKAGLRPLRLALSAFEPVSGGLVEFDKPRYVSNSA